MKKAIKTLGVVTGAMVGGTLLGASFQKTGMAPAISAAVALAVVTGYHSHQKRYALLNN